MSQRRCPVITGYLKGLRDAVRFPSSLASDLWDPINEIEEHAAEVTLMIAAQRLRTFYLMEVMYHVVLPAQTWILKEPELKGTVLAAKFSRSKEGVEELEKLLQQLHRKLILQQATVAFTIEPTAHGAFGLESATGAQLTEMLEKPRQVIDYLMEAASILKTQLRGEALRVGRVAELCGRAIVTAGTELEYSLQHARILLNITATQGASLWNMTNDYRV